jgi:hypothetical protein
MSDQKVKFFKAKSGRKLAIRKNEKPIDLKSDEHNESSDSSEIELTAPSSSLAKSRRQIRGRNLICTV